MTNRYRVGIVPTPILQNPSFPQLGYDGMWWDKCVFLSCSLYRGPLTFSLIIVFAVVISCFTYFIGIDRQHRIHQGLFITSPNLYNHIYRGWKFPLQTFEILSCTRKTCQGCRQPPRLSSDKDRWYGVTWCASWFSYNFMLPIHPQTETMQDSRGSLRWCPGRNCSAAARAPKEGAGEASGVIKWSIHFWGGSNNANQMVILRDFRFQ